MPATHTCLCMPSTGHPHAIHMSSTRHPHAIHTSTTRHPHICMPFTHHPHATCMSPTHHQHTTHTPLTHHLRGIHTSPTSPSCHPHATHTSPHTIHKPPARHPDATCYPPPATHTPPITHYPHTLVYTCPHTQRHHHRGKASERPQVTPYKISMDQVLTKQTIKEGTALRSKHPKLPLRISANATFYEMYLGHLALKVLPRASGWSEVRTAGSFWGGSDQPVVEVLALRVVRGRCL